MPTHDEERETIYHYSRSERLKSASKLVQELNYSETPKKTSLFKTLTATKSSAFLLLAIIMLSATAIVIRLLPTDSNSVSLAGITFKAKAFTWNNDTFLSISTISSNKRTDTVNELQVEILNQDDVLLHTANLLYVNTTNQAFNYKLPETVPKIIKLIFTTPDKESAILQISVRNE